MNLRDLNRGEDRPTLERFLAIVEQHDGHPALGERKLFDVVDPVTAALASPGMVAEDESGVFAYAALRAEEAGLFTVEIVAHPDYRTPIVLGGFLREAVEVTRARGARRVRLWAYIPEVMQAAEKAGFAVERELFHMRAPLPIAEIPRFAAGLAVRGFQEGVDESVWIAANNQVFSGHPENGNWGLEDLDRRRRRPWFSAAGLRMAWDRDRLAGYCWTKTPSPQAGEIYVIGVLPGYQGQGLGRALLLEGMRHMHTQDRARACVLYVDAANLPALKMYRAMGFQHHHTDRSYLGSVSGQNLSG